MKNNHGGRERARDNKMSKEMKAKKFNMKKFFYSNDRKRNGMPRIREPIESPSSLP